MCWAKLATVCYALQFDSVVRVLAKIRSCLVTKFGQGIIFSKRKYNNSAIEATSVPSTVMSCWCGFCRQSSVYRFSGNEGSQQ